jgi:peroxiredoxin Q/BCP
MQRMSFVTRIGVIAAVFALATFGAVAQDEEKTVDLKVGDQAPDFKLIGSDGKYYTLKQFKGKKPVVLAFFPKAFTGG